MAGEWFFLVETGKEWMWGFGVNASRTVGVCLGLAAAIAGVGGPLEGPGGLRPWHLLMVLALCTALLGSYRGRFLYLRVTPIDILFILFVIGSGISEMVNAADVDSGFDINSVVSPLYYYIGYISVRLVVHCKHDCFTLLRSICIGVVPQALVCVLQLVSLEFARAPLLLAPAPGLAVRIDTGGTIRSTGLIGHWTGVGFYFCAIITCVCILWLARDREESAGFGLYEKVAGTSAFVGAITTLTFSVILTAILVLLFTLSYGRARVSAFIGVGAVSLLVYAAFSSSLNSRFEAQRVSSAADLPPWVPNTLAYRWTIWSEQTLPAIMERPLTGWGSNIYSTTGANYSSLPVALSWGSAESQWLAISAFFGIPMAIAFALLIAVSAKRVQKASRRNSDLPEFRPLLVLILCVLAASFTVPAFTNRGLPILLWAMVGMVIALASADSRSTSKPGPDGDRKVADQELQREP